ncbi:helix-turn-helix domain-containing protein [Streptococcus sp. X16XC17]|uniref:helix-turn-helix transcriptional regulator n=2 Tax=unclassified Streptococcus TaxID=2608887 RepID=UPI00320A2F87
MNQENQHQRWREVVRGREELATLLTVDQPLYLLAEAAPVTDQFTIERMIGQQSFYFYFLPQLPHQSVFFVEEIDATSRMDVVVDKIERKLFYGHIPKKLQATTRAFYQELLPHLESGQVHRLEQALPDIVEKLQSAAPAVYLTKQLFNQIMTDVYHRFKQLERSRLEDYFQKIESSQDLQTLLTVTLSHLLDIRERHQYSHHVEEVLDIIKREYQTELTLKEVSDRLFLNTVYLGQIIKKETGATFAELLNRKRIKMAQQLLVTGDYGIEEICFRVGYTNIGYFYKIFKRFCG